MDSRLPVEPGFYRDADGDLWVIAPGSTTLRVVVSDGMRVTDDDAELGGWSPSHLGPFTRVRMVPADD